jgi:hypothetical protein
MSVSPCLTTALIPSQRQPSRKRKRQTNHRTQHRNRHARHDAGAAATASAAAAAIRAARSRHGAVAGLLVRDLADDEVGDVAGRARVGALGVLGEADVGAVVEGGAVVADGDDLDGGEVAVGGPEVGGQGQLGDAEGAVAGGVPEGRGEGVVEGGDVGAEAEVDEDVGPGVVELEGEGAAVEGPVGGVAGVGGCVCAWGLGVKFSKFQMFKFIFFRCCGVSLRGDGFFWRGKEVGVLGRGSARGWSGLVAEGKYAPPWETYMGRCAG